MTFEPRLCGGVRLQGNNEVHRQGGCPNRTGTDTTWQDKSVSMSFFRPPAPSDCPQACHDRCPHRRCSPSGERILSADSGGLANDSPRIRGGEAFPAGNSRARRNFRSSLDARGPVVGTDGIRLEKSLSLAICSSRSLRERLAMGRGCDWV